MDRRLSEMATNQWRRAMRRYSIKVWSVNGPCRVWTVGASLMAPMLAPTGPVWSCSRSNSWPRSWADTAWAASYQGSPMSSSGGTSCSGGTSRASVSDPGGANRVTSWPRSVSPSASSATTHSMPP